MQLATLQESLFDIKFQYLNKKEELELHLKSLIMQLQTGIDNWELAYLLKSPIDGRITFTNYWVENQNVTAGEQVFNIVPLNTREYIGRALLPMERSGKVEIGQKVNIDFSNFPSNEFGTVKGIIQNISLVATESNNQNYYLIEIVFPNKLHTNYQKELPFIPEMKGKASIITKNISLLERIFMPLKKILMDNA